MKAQRKHFQCRLFILYKILDLEMNLTRCRLGRMRRW